MCKGIQRYLIKKKEKEILKTQHALKMVFMHHNYETQLKFVIKWQERSAITRL